jgi:hypothetical protein
MIQAKFGLNWPSGFRGEDFWKSLQTDDGRRTTDAKWWQYLTWPFGIRWAKKREKRVSVMVLNGTFNNISVNYGDQFYWWRKPKDP